MLATDLRTALDKMAIQEVCAQYVFAHDSGDFKTFESCFSENLIWEVRIPTREEPVYSVSGRQEFVDMIMGIMDNQPDQPKLSKLQQDVIDVGGSFHAMGGMVFDELTATTARTRAICFPILQTIEDDGRELDLTNWPSIVNCSVESAGVYHDEFLKVDGEWKISKRVFLASAAPLK